ncbi:MAG TPA: GspH/FimT family pseudopilin [Methylomirabilota bacterium]|nr:GspH/FimT family pseudopilin [Methylomirabilota bacterium]
MRDRRGFTLIELAVALFVLALAAAVATPAIGRGLEALRVRSEVAGVASFLRAARERAITRRDALEVAVEADGHALVLRARDGGVSGDAGVRAVRRLPSTVRVAADPPSAPAPAFLAHGASTGGAFRLETPGAVYSVIVEPFTGRVTSRRIDS